MPNIRLTITLPRKKRDEPVPRRDTVWPTMLPDDEPSLRSLQVEIFRGDTKDDPENPGRLDHYTGVVWRALTERGRIHLKTR